MILAGKGFWEVTGSWGCSPRESDLVPYKRHPIDLPSCISTQQEDRYLWTRKQALNKPWICQLNELVLFSLPEWWDINFHFGGFPGGPMVKNPSANAGDTGSVPGLWGFHMLLCPCATTTEALTTWAPCSTTREATTMRSPCSWKLEKAHRST